MTHLSVEYTVYEEESRAKFIVRESGDVPGLTDIIQREDHGPDWRITLKDESLPALIEALQRRLADVKEGKP